MGKMKEGSQGRQVRGKDRGRLNRGSDTGGYVTGPTGLDSETSRPTASGATNNEKVTGGYKGGFPKKGPKVG